MPRRKYEKTYRMATLVKVRQNSRQDILHAILGSLSRRSVRFPELNSSRHRTRINPFGNANLNGGSVHGERSRREDPRRDGRARYRKRLVTGAAAEKSR